MINNRLTRSGLTSSAEVLRETDGRGVDGMLEMSGHPQAFKDGFDMLANGGRDE